MDFRTTLDSEGASINKTLNSNEVVSINDYLTCSVVQLHPSSAMMGNLHVNLACDVM